MTPFHEKVVPLRTRCRSGVSRAPWPSTCTPVRPARAGSSPGRRSGDVVTIDQQARGRLEQWAHRYAQAAVEIVGGDRPVSQLLRWTTPRVYEDLQRRAQLVARAVGQRAGQGRVQAIRPQVVGVRTCFVAGDAAEVSAHVRYGRRSRALALRFEVISDRWQCVALDFA